MTHLAALEGGQVLLSDGSKERGERLVTWIVLVVRPLGEQGIATGSDWPSAH